MEIVTEHNDKKIQSQIFLVRQSLSSHFLKKRDTMEIIMLIIIMVVMGK
jgi:hypothetical protein